MARKLGANHIIVTSKGTVLAKEAVNLLGEEPDVVIDACGIGQTAKEAVEVNSLFNFLNFHVST